MKYKRIQYCIVYFLFSSCLFISKDQLIPANNLWMFLFNNYYETNMLLFFIINLFYLFILYLYIPRRKSLFKLLHFIFNKLYYLKIILFLLDIYYFIYLKYFRVKQFYIMKIHLYIISNPNLFEKYYFKGCLYLSIFEPNIFIPNEFKSNQEKQFYLNLYKNFYLFPICIKLNNRIYRLTLVEFIELINFHAKNKFGNLKKNVDQFLSSSKILNKFIKLVSFWLQINNLYYDLHSADFTLGIKFYLKYLCGSTFVNYNIQPTAYLIKLIKKDRRLIRQFIILLLHKNFKSLKKVMKKKRICLDLNKLSNNNKTNSIFNINNIQFKFVKPQDSQNYFNKIQFNLFYLYYKNISTLKNLYKSIVISNFFKEFKVMYQLIKFLFFFISYHFLLLKTY